MTCHSDAHHQAPHRAQRTSAISRKRWSGGSLIAAVLFASAPAMMGEDIPPEYRLLSMPEAVALKLTHYEEAKRRHPDQTWPAARSEAIEAWKDMRFGMMIHWGPCTLKELEISWTRDVDMPAASYDALSRQFNPTRFDPAKWMGLAKRAGMRYVVPVTKHHDGFCLWPTRYTDFSIANTSFRRDVIGELAAACKDAGLKFGLYFSVSDWHYPAFPWTGKQGLGLRTSYDWTASEDFVNRQVDELVTAYGPLVTLWFDKPDHYLGRAAAMIRSARAKQPDILINNRSGNDGDYRTPEQVIGAFDNGHPWESCMTISRHSHWSWAGPQDGTKDQETCLKMLIHAAGGGGNLLLNVSPTPEGEIPADQTAVLEYMGAWLGRNGEAIYSTRGGPYKPTVDLASTHRGNTVYLHVLKWPEGNLVLPRLGKRVVAGSLLSGGEVAVKQTDASLELAVPPAARQPVDTIVKLVLEGPAADIPPVDIGGAPFKPWPTDWETGLTKVDAMGLPLEAATGK